MPPKKRARPDDLPDPLAETAAGMSHEISSLEHDELIERLEKLTQLWKIDNPPTSYSSVVETAMENAGITMQGDINHDDEGSYGLGMILSAFELKEIEAVTLFAKLKEHGVLEESKHNSAIRRVLESIFYAKKICLSVVQSKISNHETYTIDDDISERLGSYSIRFRWLEDVKTTDLQKLIIYLLDVAMEKNYRKYDGHIFKPIVSNGFKTFAYDRVCSVKEFVHAESKKESNLEAFLQLTKSSITTIIDHLENCVDIQFPFLVKDRGVFSFRNGLYICETDTFVPYDIASEVVPETTVSSNFFDIDFDTRYTDSSWREIQTPNSEKIFYDQKLSLDVRQWVYVVIGRMLYEIGKHDGWQIIPMLLGVAGSGKSTITDYLVGSIYDTVDVGVLSNNCERQWAVSGLISKLIWICPEIKSDFALEQATFQSMVSGERISVAAKHKTPYSTRFVLPGFLAGNVLPEWKDNAGSISRRMLIFRFDQKITEHDMLLGSRIRDELPRFIVKANRAYREMAEVHGTKNIWSVLPPDLIVSSTDAMNEADPLSNFIKSDQCALGPEYSVKLDEFASQFTAWCMDFGISRPRGGLSGILSGRDLDKYGLRVVKANYIVNGTQHDGSIVVGVRIKDATRIESFSVM